MASKNHGKLLPTNDLLFKKTFTSPESEPILRGFIQDITGLEIDSVMTEETYSIHNFDLDQLKETSVDVRARTSAGEAITIEIQRHPHLSFWERTKYYACELYTKFYIAEDGRPSYPNLRKVYDINIMDWDEFPQGPARLTFVDWCLELGETAEDLDKRSTHLYYLSLTNPKPQNDLIRYWQLFFKGQALPSRASSYIHQAERIVNHENLTKEERQMAESISKREAIIEAEKAYEWEDGWEKGREEGYGRGLEMGRVQERESMYSKLIRSYHSKGMSTEDIAGLLEVAPDYVEAKLQELEAE